MSELPEPTEALDERELAALPVFPLPRVVFFPGSTLPLHLFEARYRELMEDCVSRGPMAMAVTLLKPGYEEDYEGRPPICEISGAGRIIDWSRRPDGRFDVLLHGLSRVRLQELPAEGLSYRRARATLLSDQAPRPEPIRPLVKQVLSISAAVASAVRRAKPDFSLGLDANETPARIADRIADRLVADVEARQRILEALDVEARLGLVHEALIELLGQLPPSGAEGVLH